MPAHRDDDARPGRVFDLLRSPFASGTTIIEASAGTGKTYCLTGLVLRALLEGRAKGARELLVVTFTNAATDELVGRIRAALRTARDVLLGELAPPDEFYAGLADRFSAAGEQAVDGASILRHALLDIDDLTVATIHGFCKRVLDEAAFEGGLPFELELVENDDDLWLDSSRDVWRRLLADARLGATLLPALIAEEKLEPGSFRADYREWRRHPSTELLPRALPLLEAAERVELARTAAGRAFQRVRWRMALSRLDFKAGCELADREKLRAALEAAERFLAGEADGLWAAQLLAPQRLLPAVERSARAGLEKLPGFAELGLFEKAYAALHHALRAHVLGEVHERFAAAKSRGAVHSFDDLLHQLRAALCHPSHGPRLRAAVRSRYRLALIDEFQDTDLVQYDIFRRLFDDAPLILVGDPKQAIYRFRGADVFAYLGAKRHADHLFTLTRNWRSGEKLVAAVNALFERSPQPFALDDIPYPGASSAERAAGRRLMGDELGALVWLHVEREERSQRATERILSATAREVAALLGSGVALAESDGTPERELRPRDLAILVRTNQQAQQMQERLRELGVPAVLGRSGDIYRSEELEEVLRLMAGVLAPSDAGRLRAACSTVLWGDDAAALQALSRDDRLFAERVETFARYRDLWLERGFIAAMERLLRERGVRRRLAGLERGERRLTNLQHAIELAHQAAHEHHLSPTGLLAFLRTEQRSEVHDRSAVELRLESDDEAVQLVTVHKSKGLEYEVVFCPFLWQARPVVEAPVLVHETPENLLYDFGSERLGRHLQMAEAERLAEDLRLTYVALTRARRRCYVVWGAIGRGPRSAKSGLAWLLHRRQARFEQGEPNDGTDAARRVADGLMEAAERHERWLEDVEGLVTQNPATMSLRALDEESLGEKWSSQAAAADRLEAARLAPGAAQRLQSPWRIASFSSLTRGAALSHGDDPAEIPDHADLDLPGKAASPASPPGPARGLFAFARGPRAGDCLHGIFEEIDFTHPEGFEDVVDRALRRFRLGDAERHAREAPPDYDPRKAVLEMLHRVLDRRLPGGLRLAEVERGSRLVEWQFYAPLPSKGPERLADLFERHGDRSWSADYAARLRRLSPGTLEGFLTGFVDLVARHDGRWYVLDWKSNHLGDRFEDYGRDSMQRAMIDHHYLLQAHLYAVALDRYLRLHVAEWDYERDFGGIYYVFLRGVDESTEAPSPARRTKRPERTPDSSGRGQLGLFAAAEGASPTAEANAEEVPEGPSAGDGARGIYYLRPDRRLVAALADELLGDGELP